MKKDLQEKKINCEWIAKAIWKNVKSMNYPNTARDVS